MAIDRVKILSKVSETIIDKTKMYRIPNPDNEFILVDGLKARACGVGIMYLPRLDGGTLFLDFNIPKMLKGDNIHSVWSFNTQSLWESLYSAVMPVVSLASPDKDCPAPPHLRYWKVNYFEFNFDLIDLILTINQYYKAVSKIEVARLDRFTEYDVFGTVYNISNRTLKDSNIIERTYFKLIERVDRGEAKSTRDYEDRVDLLNLLPGQDVLRFEAAYTRPKIRYEFKNNKNIPKYEEKPLGMFQYSSTPLFPGCFGELVNMGFQHYLFERIISKYHLDKTITTRPNLYKVINNSSLFSPCKASTAKKIIRFLNGDTKAISYSHSTINEYKRLILETGYHYITADFELPPITFDYIHNSLTCEQKISISKYRSSDLIKDNIDQYYSLNN